MPMTQKAAGSILRRNAPRGEFPAYINPQEASWLRGMGGSGRPTKSGLRSYVAEDVQGSWSQQAADAVGSAFRRDQTEAGKQAEHDRVARMNQRIEGTTYDAQGNPIDAIVQGGADATSQIRDSLGNLVGGGGQQTRQNTSTSVSEIDRPSHEFRQDIYDRATDVMDTPYTKYGADRFAGASADTTTAQQGVRDIQGTGQLAYGEAAGVGKRISGQNIDPITGQSFLTGQGVDQYMSPHTANVIGGMRENAMRTMQMQRNQLGADAQMAGAGIGSRSAIEKGVMAGEVQRGLGQQVAGALEGSYAQAAQMKKADMEREQQRQRYNQLSQTEEGRLQLAGSAEQRAGTAAGRQAGYQDASMLSRVGADIEGREQNVKDFAYDEYLEGRDWDKGNVMFGSNVLSGAPVGTTTTQTNPQYRNTGTDRWGRAIAGAGAGWLAAGPYGAVAGGAMGYFS